MDRKGAIIVAIMVWIIYPLVTAAVIAPVMIRDRQQGGSSTTGSSAAKEPNPNGLSDFEMKHGLGPIKVEVKLGALDPALAAKGHEVFKLKCSACHKMESRYVGPPLRGVVTFRGPTYVLNMILNPQEMTQKHPVARGLLAQYMTVMTFQNVSQDDARAIVEYFRKDAEDSQAAPAK